MRALHPFSVCISVLFFIWSGAASAASFTLQKVVAVGDPSPLGGTFNDLALPVINDHGDVLFWATLEGAEAGVKKLVLTHL